MSIEPNLRDASDPEFRLYGRSLHDIRVALHTAQYNNSLDAYKRGFNDAIKFIQKVVGTVNIEAGYAQASLRGEKVKHAVPDSR